MVIHEFQTCIGLRDVTFHETLVDTLCGQFHTFFVGNALDVFAELDLQVAREVQAVVLLENIGDATLAGLRVDADDRLIGTTDILGVDRQVGHFPYRMIGNLDGLHALVDRVLVRTGKRRINQLADVRVTFRDRHFVGIFIDGLDTLDITAIQARIDALRVHVQCQCHHIHIAGTFAVAEQRAFHTVSTRHQSQFCCSDARAAVVVRMQGDDDIFAVVDVAAHPFDLVGIDVRCRHLHGGRQVQDEFVVGRRLNLGDHGVADLQSHVQLCAGEAFRRIFEAITTPGLGRHIGNHRHRRRSA